jgi:hypothetical protein
LRGEIAGMDEQVLLLAEQLLDELLSTQREHLQLLTRLAPAIRNAQYSNAQ